jgi:hypothetical protein
MSERIHVFSSGSQFADWEMGNCDNCKKSIAPEGKRYKCPLQKEIHRAYSGDGTISKECADRIGYEPLAYGWWCPEKENVDQKRERKPSKTREHGGQMKLGVK